MESIVNEIIVIGQDHYNALSVIRSLGKCGVKPIFLLIGKDEGYYASKSRYIKKCLSVDNECDVLAYLKKIYKDYKNKPVLIPTGDPIEKLLDQNYDELSKHYYLPNINNKKGEIIKFMDKTIQEKLCKKYNVLTASSYLVNTEDFVFKKSYPNRVILKPYISADGKKSDIIIAESKENIIAGINKLKKMGYKKVLMQEYLDYEVEYAMMGMSYKGNVLIPGINSNDYIYPSNRGNTSFATMFPVKDFEFDISNIIKMVEDLNYTGLFEIETFKIGKSLYFNEMNFRNSANLLGYRGDKINYILLYVMQVLNMDISSEKKKVTKKFHFCIETHHLKNAIKEKKLSLIKSLYHITISTKVIFVISDMKPLLYKIKHFINKRLSHGDKNEK